jgi:hypothetical protein
MRRNSKLLAERESVYSSTLYSLAREREASSDAPAAVL